MDSSRPKHDQHTHASQICGKATHVSRAKQRPRARNTKHLFQRSHAACYIPTQVPTQEACAASPGLRVPHVKVTHRKFKSQHTTFHRDMCLCTAVHLIRGKKKVSARAGGPVPTHTRQRACITPTSPFCPGLGPSRNHAPMSCSPVAGYTPIGKKHHPMKS